MADDETMGRNFVSANPKFDKEMEREEKNSRKDCETHSRDKFWLVGIRGVLPHAAAGYFLIGRETHSALPDAGMSIDQRF